MAERSGAGRRLGGAWGGGDGGRESGAENTHSKKYPIR